MDTAFRYREMAMKPTVFSVDSVDLTASRLETICRDGVQPTLAIVFSDAAHNIDNLRTIFARHSIQVFGASSSGEFTHEGVVEGSITVMLMDIPHRAFQLNVFESGAGDTPELGQSIARWAKETVPHPALLIMSAGLHANGEQIISEIVRNMEQPAPLFGGSTGLRTGTEKPYVFTEARIVENGIIALGFNKNVVELYGVAASGWKGIGTPKTITRSEGNNIYEIDDQPALDMYNKYLNIGNDPTLAYEYPLLLLRKDGSSILRGSVTVNEDKSITYGGTVPQGALVRFSIPPGLEIIGRAVDVVSQLNQQLPEADAIILFSCKGRRYTLGSMVADEISAIQRLWNIPLIGFFTDGEIGPVPNGRCELHNHTLVPVVIKQHY